MLSRPIHRLSQEVHGIFIESAALSLLPVRTAAALKFPAWKRFVRAANSIVQLGNRLRAKSVVNFSNQMTIFRFFFKGEDLVETLLEVEKKKSGNSDERVGLLSEMMGTKMKMEDLKRIVIDLILAAGDTVSTINSQ